MKKLKFLPIVLALAALFCIPTLAADDCDHEYDDSGFCIICGYVDPDFGSNPECEDWGHDWFDGTCTRCGASCSHNWYLEDDCPDSHFCAHCGYSESHVNDSDGYCIECGYRDPFFGTDYCGCFNLSFLIIFYAEDDHYAFCPEHFKIISFASLSGSALPHVPDSCDVCSSFANSGGYLFPYSAYTSGAIYCENFQDVWFRDDPEALFSGKFALLYDDMTHYASCLDCGAYCDLSVLAGPVPHTGSDCEFCAQISSMGITPSPFPSESPTLSSIFSSITDGVTSAVGWVASFAAAIVSNPLLLAASILGFIGLGIAILRRLFF